MLLFNGSGIEDVRYLVINNIVTFAMQFFYITHLLHHQAIAASQHQPRFHDLNRVELTAGDTPSRLNRPIKNSNLAVCVASPLVIGKLNCRGGHSRALGLSLRGLGLLKLFPILNAEPRHSPPRLSSANSYPRILPS